MSLAAEARAQSVQVVGKVPGGSLWKSRTAHGKPAFYIAAGKPMDF